MNISGVINDYFINPIIEHSGYNIVNTLIYAVIAMAVAFFIYKWLKPKFDRKFVLYILPFVLLGSTIRVVTDSIDSGIAQEHAEDLFGIVGLFVNSGIYGYGFATTTPGIYIFIGLLTLISIFVFDKLNKLHLVPYFALVLWIPHIIILLPMFKNWLFLFIVTGIVVVSYFTLIFILKRYKINNLMSKLVVIGHSIDGASSFVAIEIFNRIAEECSVFGRCYFGQHVVERFLGSSFLYGTFVFFLVKLIFVFFVIWFIENERKKKNIGDRERIFIYLLIIIFGFAPGIRNSLRLVIGA